MEPTDTGKADYFHKVVDCQWACPAHTDVPEYIRLIAQGAVHRRLHGESGVQCISRHSRPGLRPALRARLPARPNREQTGGHLPAEARGGRPPRRRHGTAAACAARKKRQAHRLHRRGPGLAHCRQRSAAPGLRGHHFRAVRGARRLDAHQHPGISSAGRSARRGNRLHRRHGRGPAAEFARRQHAASCSIPKSSTPCSWAPVHPRAKNSTCRGATTPIAFTSALPGSSRSPFSTSTR